MIRFPPPCLQAKRRRASFPFKLRVEDIARRLPRSFLDFSEGMTYSLKALRYLIEASLPQDSPLQKDGDDYESAGRGFQYYADNAVKWTADLIVHQL